MLAQAGFARSRYFAYDLKGRNATWNGYFGSGQHVIVWAKPLFEVRDGVNCWEYDTVEEAIEHAQELETALQCLASAEQAYNEASPQAPHLVPLQMAQAAYEAARARAEACQAISVRLEWLRRMEMLRTYTENAMGLTRSEVLGILDGSLKCNYKGRIL